MKKVIIISLMLFGIQSAWAQKEDFREKLTEQRIEFIKKKLALTVEEEKKFMPIYTNYMDEFEALRKENKESENLEKTDLTFKTDEECEKAISEMINAKEKELALIKKYNEEFKKVLPIKKVAMLYKAEHEFKREIIRKLRGGKKK